MKKYTLTLAFLLATICCMAQNVSVPQYPGGEEELNNYLKQQVALHSLPKNDKAWVSVLFYVGTSGEILRPTVAASPVDIASPSDSIALQIVKQMPKWIPGKMDDVNQEMAVNVTVRFSDEDELKSSNSQEVYTVRPVGEFADSEPDLESEIQISIAEVISSDASIEGSRAVDIAELRDHRIVEESSREQVFVSVEEMPSFPGGQTELMKFVSENLVYPIVAQGNGIQGRAVVRFVVEKDGRLSRITIVRGFDASCDKEAIAVFKKSPRWNPGKQNGQAVPVYYTCPVLFRLNK